MEVHTMMKNDQAIWAYVVCLVRNGCPTFTLARTEKKTG
jgi:hypothetical protein